MHSGWFRSTFLRVLKFLQFKEWDLISGGNQFCKKSELFGPPFCISILKVFQTQISSSFIRFQCILHVSGVSFSESWNFYKIKRGDLISGGNQFCRKSELFARPFCISILKVLSTEFLRHSWDFNAFYMIQEYFSQGLEISSN